MKSKIHIFSFISLLLLILSNCDNGNSYKVPSVPVSLQLSLATDLSRLGVGESVLIVPDSSEFGWIEFINGTKIYTSQKVFGRGLILYRYANDEFKVYDRTCSYVEDDYCGIELTQSMINAECPCCGSTFEVVYSGASIKGPASSPLREYTATVIATYLILSN